MAGTGTIVNPSMLDTISTSPVQPTTTYPPTVIGGKTKTLETIKTNQDSESPDKIKIMDVMESMGTHPSVPGVDPLATPNYPSIARPAIVAVQNTTVFFEGELVTCAGDAMLSDPITIGSPRPIVDPLTTFTNYPTIRIGTNPL